MPVSGVCILLAALLATCYAHTECCVVTPVTYDAPDALPTLRLVICHTDFAILSTGFWPSFQEQFARSVVRTFLAVICTRHQTGCEQESWIRMDQSYMFQAPCGMHCHSSGTFPKLGSDVST